MNESDLDLYTDALNQANKATAPQHCMVSANRGACDECAELHEIESEWDAIAESLKPTKQEVPNR